MKFNAMTLYLLLLITCFHFTTFCMEQAPRLQVTKGSWGGLPLNPYYYVKDGTLSYSKAFYKRQNELKRKLDKDLAEVARAEAAFKQILQNELIKSEEFHWEYIKPLLEMVGAYNLENSKLEDELLALSNDKNPQYCSWLGIIQKYAPHDLQTDKPQELTAPEFQAPEAPIKSRVEESQVCIESNNPFEVQKTITRTVVNKKKKKKKTKKLITHNDEHLQIPLHAPLNTPVTPIRAGLKLRSVQLPQRPSLIGPYKHAILNQHYDLLARLLTIPNSGIDVNTPLIPNGPTALHYSAIKPDLLLMRMLMDHKADPNILTCISMPERMLHKVTPLALAVNCNFLEGVRFLLEHKADPNIALEYENVNKSVQLQNRLYKGFALDMAATSFNSDEQQEIIENQKQIVRLLLLHGASEFNGKVYFCDIHGEQGYQITLGQLPTNIFMRYMLVPTTDIVLVEGNIYLIPDHQTYANIMKIDKQLNLNTFVHYEESRVDQNGIQLLLNKCIAKNDPQDLDSFLKKYEGSIELDRPLTGMTFSPLIQCITQRKLDLCRVLLKYGANPNAKNNIICEQLVYEANALPFAYLSGDIEIFKLLIKYGMNINDKAIDSEILSETPLTLLMEPYFKDHTFYTQQERKELIKTLLLAGAVECKFPVLMHVPSTGQSITLNLKNETDQVILTWILAPDDGIDHITCQPNGTLVLEYTERIPETPIMAHIHDKLPNSDTNEQTL